MYMDYIKYLAKNEKELETMIQIISIYTQDIKVEFGIEKCAMILMRSGKRQRNRTTKSKTIKILGEKETL